MSTIPTITKPAYWVQLSKNGKRLFWPGVFYNEQAARGQAHVYAENIGASGYSVYCADPKTGLVTVALYGDDLNAVLDLEVTANTLELRVALRIQSAFIALQRARAEAEQRRDDVADDRYARAARLAGASR